MVNELMLAKARNTFGVSHPDFSTLPALLALRVAEKAPLLGQIGYRVLRSGYVLAHCMMRPFQMRRLIMSHAAY